MKRLFIILAIVVLLTLPGALGYAAFAWKFTPHPPKANYPTPENETAARLQDLDYLRKLPITDKSFSDQEIAALNTFIDGLEVQASEMSGAGFAMAVARAAAISENGHTNLSRTDLHQQLNSLPVRFHWFADGLYILRAHANYSELLGAKVITYDGQTPAMMLDTLGDHVGGNDPWKKNKSGAFFGTPAGLHAIGLASQSDRATLDVQLPDGSLRTITIPVEQVATRMMREDLILKREINSYEEESGHDWRFLSTEAMVNSRFTHRATDLHWSEELPGEGTYVRLGGIFNAGDIVIADWLKGLTNDFKAAPRDYLVLDLRTSPGGDYTKVRRFALQVADYVEPDGKVYILTDAGTFSAAIVAVAFAKHGAGDQGVIVGEEIGDFEQFWAEGGGAHTLPNSGMRIWVSTGYHDWENGCTDWGKCFWLNVVGGVAAGPLTPMIDAPMTFADYINGVDPSMDAVLAEEGI